VRDGQGGVAGSSRLRSPAFLEWSVFHPIITSNAVLRVFGGRISPPMRCETCYFLFQGCHFQVHSHARRSKAMCWQTEVSQCGLLSLSTRPEYCVFYYAGPRRVGPWISSGRTPHLQSYCALTRSTTCSMATVWRVCGQAPHEESPVPSDGSGLPLIYDQLIAPTAPATKW